MNDSTRGNRPLRADLHMLEHQPYEDGSERMSKQATAEGKRCLSEANLGAPNRGSGIGWLQLQTEASPFEAQTVRPLFSHGQAFFHQRQEPHLVDSRNKLT